MANKTICALTYGDTHVFTLPYGTCSTAAGTAAKAVSVPGNNFALESGARVVVKFTTTNTAANPTLNVSSTGAKAIVSKGSAIKPDQLAAKGIYEFLYDGTNWEMVGNADAVSVSQVEDMIKNVSNYNFIQNWNFQDPINSKGLNSYAGAQYTIDKWYMTHATSTVAINENSITVTNPQTSAYAWFRQYLDCGYLPYGTYTLSILVESVGNCSVYFGDDNGNNVGGVYQLTSGLNTFTETIPASTCSRVQFVIGYNSSMTIKGVKIERGSLSTLATKLPNGTWELRTDGWDSSLENIKSNDGSNSFEVGDLKQSLNPSLKNESWLKCDGSFFSTAAYPDLYSTLAQTTRYDGSYSVISNYTNYQFCNNTHIFINGNKIYYSPLTDMSNIQLGGSMPSTISSISRVKFINNKYVALCKGTDGRNYICISNGITSAFTAYRIANDASDNKPMSLSSVAYFKGYYVIAVNTQFKTSTSYTCGYLYISPSSLVNDASWTYKQFQSYTDSSSYSYGIIDCMVNEGDSYIYFTTWRSGGSTDYSYIRYGSAIDNAMGSSYTLVSSYYTNDAALVKVGSYIYAVGGASNESGNTQKQSAVYVTTSAPTTFTTLTSFTSNGADVAGVEVNGAGYFLCGKYLGKITAGGTFTVLADGNINEESSTSKSGGFFVDDANRILLYKNKNGLVTNAPFCTPNYAFDQGYYYIKAK